MLSSQLAACLLGKPHLMALCHFEPLHRPAGVMPGGRRPAAARLQASWELPSTSCLMALHSKHSTPYERHLYECTWLKHAALLVIAVARCWPARSTAHPHLPEQQHSQDSKAGTEGSHSGCLLWLQLLTAPSMLLHMKSHMFAILSCHCLLIV